MKILKSPLLKSTTYVTLFNKKRVLCDLDVIFHPYFIKTYSTYNTSIRFNNYAFLFFEIIYEND